MLIFSPVSTSNGNRALSPLGIMFSRLSLFLSLALAPLSVWSSPETTKPAELARNRSSFVGFDSFNYFNKSPGTNTGEIVLTSPAFNAPIEWNELVASWNVPTGVHLKVEARAIYPDHTTKYYTMSLWSDDPKHFPRESVRKQQDSDGTVQTDTLILDRIAKKAQLRVTLGGTNAEKALKFLGVNFCNSKVQTIALKPNQEAWGKVLEVPERRQVEYEGGGGWCSPTSLSMGLAYWRKKLDRPELNQTVCEVAESIADGNLGGTGNWPFNTAYAGSFPGMRAYVTRFSDVAELEDWICAGVPVVISVSSYLTTDRSGGRDNGHLIICVGFDEKGDVVVNDPGVSVRRNERARRIYAREKVINAWKKSKNAVYLVYPETTKVPKDRYGHWFEAH